MKEFDKFYYKYMLEAKTDTANQEQVGKRVHDELMSYMDKKKDDMSAEDYTKVQGMVKDVADELNPETIFDDLMKIGEIVGLKDSYSRVVGTVVTIVDELESPESMKTALQGEPEAEPEAEPPAEDELEVEPEPEEEPSVDDDLDLDPEEDEEEDEKDKKAKKAKKDELDFDL